MTTCGCWRPRSSLAPMSQRCSPRAPPPAVSCEPARRERSSSHRPARYHGRSLSVADFFAGAFTLVGDVESCLALRYEALVLRDAKYNNNLQLQVSRQEWLTFAKDSFGNGFYTITSKAFANAVAHTHPSHPGYLDTTKSIVEKEPDFKSWPSHYLHSILSADYMKERASGVLCAKYNLE